MLNNVNQFKGKNNIGIYVQCVCLNLGPMMNVYVYGGRYLCICTVVTVRVCMGFGVQQTQ